MSGIIKKTLFILLILSTTASVYSQTKPRKPKAKKTVAETKTKSESVDIPAQTTTVKSPGKKNERPEVQTDSAENTNQKQATNSRPAAEKPEYEPVYFYEFSQPNFIISRIIIEHDEKGTGKISFLKKGLDELISDPIRLSPATLEKINSALTVLNFFESNENYQYEKDYSHLGNIRIKVKKDGRERETKYNYTTNQDAKALADEYRKIGQQYIWIFDINLARANQPLESPRLLDSLDSLIRRNEISDTEQMLPFLKELSNDEKIPLISRNHAVKIIKQIEKNSAKNK